MMNVHVGEKWKALIKLRKQFGHATYDRLAQLMNNAGNTKCTDVASLEILRTIYENQQKFCTSMCSIFKTSSSVPSCMTGLVFKMFISNAHFTEFGTALTTILPIFKGKVKTHKYTCINRQNQSTTGKL
jgi:hypothetical protein